MGGGGGVRGERESGKGDVRAINLNGNGRKIKQKKKKNGMA